jgi:hypothetical protein
VTSRAVVAALVVLALVAAGDALRRVGSSDPGGGPSTGEPARAERVELAAAEPAEFVAVGPRLADRVLRGDREYLSADAIAAGFPGPARGPIHVAQIAVARNGTLALGVYRFPSAQPIQGAVELWRGRRLVGAFTVPSGYFGGGIAVDRSGSYVAGFSHDGALRGVFDRNGRRLDGLPASFVLVD